MGVVSLRGHLHTPCMFICPHMSDAPYTFVFLPCIPVHLSVSRGYLHMIWGWGTSKYPIFVGSGDISSSVRHFCV